MSFLETVKTMGKLQPGDCQCLPEITKHVIRFTIEAWLFEANQERESTTNYAAKYPAMVKRQTELLHAHEQYKKGLVTARDLHMSMTPEYIEELDALIEAHEFVVKELMAIPNCKR